MDLLELWGHDMTTDVSAIDHPPHYTAHPSGIECIDVVRHMGFNLGNVVKYVWRADEKNAPIEDLEKAAWYLADEIAKRRLARTCSHLGCSNPADSKQFDGLCTKHEPF